jgi:hypothetical protein
MTGRRMSSRLLAGDEIRREAILINQTGADMDPGFRGKWE